MSSEQYFALIRNFRRHAFVLLYLFGASPALCPCFVQGREHSSADRLGDAARPCTCHTPRRCAWGAWAARAMPRPPWP